MRTTAIGLVMVVALATGIRAEVIDRILAVAAGNIITLSDVNASMRLGFFTPPAGADAVAATLERLIDRALMLVEVDRYSPPDPDEAVVAAGVDAIRSRVGGQAQLDAILTQVGMSPEQLRRRVRDGLRIRAYLDQRFGATLQPSDEDVLQYYREHPTEFTRAGALIPFEEARSDAREKLIASRRTGLIDAWVQGLRNRAEVNVLYLPGKG